MNSRFSTVFLRIFFLCFFLLSAYCFVLTDEGKAQGPPRITLETGAPQKLSITVGKSIIIRSPEPVKRVSLAAPEIAEARILTPRQIYVYGKAPGVTTLTLWGVDENVSGIIDLEVSADISRLKENLHKILPEEKDIRVITSNDNITLSGTVSSTSNLSQVLALAEPYSPKKVINLLEVAGVHQVMVEVRVSEMSRSLLRRLGFNFNYIGTGGKAFGLSLLSKLTSLPTSGAFPGSPVTVSDKISGVFSFVSKGATWTTFIDALKEEGLLKVLAEPTLIALSGKSANFLAGGEIPIPVPQPGAGTTTVTIEYKPFGVGLNFTPVVLSNKKINMLVAPEVSELDFSNAITISGFVIPALTTRRASTTIELDDGQSFAIAGLLKDEIKETIDKFPILGDIPILGALFRSTSYQKNDTELIIIVTPHLVKPLDMAKQTLPTDQFIEPDDFEFYLLGNIEGREKTRSLRSGSSSPGPDKKWGLEGDFGHIVPK